MLEQQLTAIGQNSPQFMCRLIFMDVYHTSNSGQAPGIHELHFKMSYNLIMATSRHYTAGFTQAEFKVFSEIMSEFVYLKKTICIFIPPQKIVSYSSFVYRNLYS